MKTLNIELGDRSYDITIATGLLEKTGDLVLDAVKARRAVVVSHPSIHRLYGDKVEKSLAYSGFLVDTILCPEGEDNKSLAQAENVFDRLLEFHCDRTSVLVALGGGVIGDLAGFVAATFMRGIPFVQIPTTLLAQVDSSVGGKTAVNHPKGKNMIGAFYQPRKVIIDLDTLKTLPTDEFRSGMAEVIKYGVILNPDLFDFLDVHSKKIMSLQTDYLASIIETSCAIKAQVVEKDELESRQRMILNFGHTLGHAVEVLTDYKRYKHGEAVAIGMVFAAKLSYDMGRCSADVARKIADLLEKFGLPTCPPELTSEAIIQSMYHDKKNQDENIKFILARNIGNVEIVDRVDEPTLGKSLKDFFRQTMRN